MNSIQIYWCLSHSQTSSFSSIGYCPTRVFSCTACTVPTQVRGTMLHTYLLHRQDITNKRNTMYWERSKTSRANHKIPFLTYCFYSKQGSHTQHTVTHTTLINPHKHHTGYNTMHHTNKTNMVTLLLSLSNAVLRAYHPTSSFLIFLKRSKDNPFVKISAF